MGRVGSRISNIGFLKRVETGLPIKDVCSHGGSSELTFYEWWTKYSGMEADEALRRNDVEVETPDSRGCWPKRTSIWRRAQVGIRVSASPARDKRKAIANMLQSPDLRAPGLPYCGTVSQSIIPHEESRGQQWKINRS